MKVFKLYSAPWGSGKDAIDFATPVMTATSLPLVASGLRGVVTNGTRYLCLRKSVDGIEEQNFNIMEFTAANGEWVGNYPVAPYHLTGRMIEGNRVVLRWEYRLGRYAPDGFYVYTGVGSVDYSTPLAYSTFGEADYLDLSEDAFLSLGENPDPGLPLKVSFSNGIQSITLPGITEATTYAIRAFRGGLIEQNTDTVTLSPLPALAAVEAAATVTWSDE